MAQTLTSSATSINRLKLPAVYGKANLTAPMLLDYGCGKYTDHIRKALPHGITYLPYDPYNQPERENMVSLYFVRLAEHVGIPVDVVCSNVLNVIDDDDTIRNIIRHIERIVARTGGVAYFTVYEGNRSGIGRQTGSDQYQRNAPLRSYLRFFSLDTTVRNGMIIVDCSC